MLVFLLTILAVAALLVLDRVCFTVKSSAKYTNLDWEIIRTGYAYNAKFYGHIYSVVKNKIKTVYETRTFEDKNAAEKFTKKICHTMRAEYGLVDEQ